MESDMANQLTVENEQTDMSAEEAHNQEMLEKVGEAEITPPGMSQDKFGGDYDKAVQAYHSGSAAVRVAIAKGKKMNKDVRHGVKQ